MFVIGADSSPSLSLRISEQLNCHFTEPAVDKFPDGEFHLKIDENLKNQIVVVVGHTRTFEEYFKLLFSLDAAKENGAEKVIAVIPYFSYARQHKVYKSGEAISSKVMVRTIAEFSDYMATVEIHDEESIGFTNKEFKNIKVISTMGDYFSREKWDYVISPDDGSMNRARDYAKLLNCDFSFFNKKRIDANTVEMEPPALDFNNKSVLLVDDIISTGGTIVKAVGLLRSMGVSKIKVSGTHGVFAHSSGEKISSLVDDLVVSDTLATPFSRISVAKPVSDEIKKWL